MGRPPKSKAIERLQRSLKRIPELKQLRHDTARLHDSPQFNKWRRDTRGAIAYVFGDQSSHVKEFSRIMYVAVVTPFVSNPDALWQRAYIEGLDKADALLRSMLDEVKEYWGDDNAATGSSGTRRNELPDTTKVFIIHGRDEGMKNTIARFLEELELAPIILHEQPDSGRTIIEKFEEHAEVAFAIVLLTPDDEGRLRDDKSNLKPRARQNVVFEFGYFMGRLGRSQVCALMKDHLERPSDLDGIVYIPFDDSEGWKLRLMQELIGAGFGIDANRAIGQ